MFRSMQTRTKFAVPMMLTSSASLGFSLIFGGDVKAAAWKIVGDCLSVEVGGHLERVRYVELRASWEKGLGNKRLHVTAEETRAAGE